MWVEGMTYLNTEHAPYQIPSYTARILEYPGWIVQVPFN